MHHWKQKAKLPWSTNVSHTKFSLDLSVLFFLLEPETIKIPTLIMFSLTLFHDVFPLPLLVASSITFCLEVKVENMLSLWQEFAGCVKTHAPASFTVFLLHAVILLSDVSAYYCHFINPTQQTSESERSGSALSKSVKLPHVTVFASLSYRPMRDVHR